MREDVEKDVVLTSSNPGEFTTTHWSVVLTAADTHASQAAEALEALCQAYWQPLYAYVRRQGHAREEAEDLTQNFFLHLLRKRFVKQADPDCGKFRTFLLTSLKHFLVSEWRKAERKKRGGGQFFVPWDTHAAEQCYAAEPFGALTSEEVYEKRWAITVMERALARLGAQYHAAGLDRLFEKLKDCLWGGEHPRPYAEIANALGLSETAVKTSVHRLRRRCRLALRAEVAQTVARPKDINEELRHLIEVFSQ